MYVIYIFVIFLESEECGSVAIWYPDIGTMWNVCQIWPSTLQWWYNADQYQQNHVSNLAMIREPVPSFEMSGYPYAPPAHKLHPCGTPSIHLHLSKISSVEHNLSNPAAWPFKDNLSHGSALYLSYIQLELEDLGYYHKRFSFYERYIYEALPIWKSVEQCVISVRYIKTIWCRVWIILCKLKHLTAMSQLYSNSQDDELHIPVTE